MSDHSQVRKWVEHIVPKYMRDFKVPGLSVAVVKEGETIYSEGFGARDPQRNLPATPDTLYGIGSITKSFVAIAIMQLVEEGKLSVDDPVGQYIPFKLGLPGKPIKIHHFLTHSSGLPSLATSSVALHRGIGI
ncbi:MAG: serine hydrolase domain-containing protein, partial [Candidatus Bathyarchaeota archaeon]